MVGIRIHNRLRGSFRNVLEVAERVSDNNWQAGHDWYPIANHIAEDIGKLSNTNTMSGAGVLAALSPSTSWENNIAQAHEFMHRGYAPYQSRANNDKARRILGGEHPLDVLGGPKVLAFYDAIIEPNNEHSAPVLDRHAIAVYMGHSVPDASKHIRYIGNKSLPQRQVLGRIEGAYRNAADDIGVNVHVLQAATWIQWREDKIGKGKLL